MNSKLMTNWQIRDSHITLTRAQNWTNCAQNYNRNLPRIRVNTKLETFFMHIVSKSFDAWRKSLWIRFQLTLHIKCSWLKLSELNIISGRRLASASILTCICKYMWLQQTRFIKPTVPTIKLSSWVSYNWI